MKIRKGDRVLILNGKDKGKQGEVLQSSPKHGKILVEGVALIKKHIKAEKDKKGNKVGQRIELPTFINVSKVKLVCPLCKEAARVGYLVTKESKKRVCKKCKKNIDDKE